MKKITLALSAALLLIAFAFAGCKGAEGGKVTDTTDNTPMLTELENELSTLADNMTDMMPDMSGNITDNNTTM
ncbi:MAG: hypothetical protein IKK63_03270 [Clostridia bacterium]|nr:hypothetical protein [Clostridia bacterium]MBR3819477.1 hypothetical protein [Clostridia bacterium]